MLVLNRVQTRRCIKWSIIFLVGFSLRIFASKIGSTFDFTSYKVVYSALLDGTTPWETRRYNYGSVWALVIFAAGKIASLHEDLFRFFLIFVLSLADGFNASFIAKYFSNKYAVYYFLNPISIVISGYYNQFDTVAIAFAAMSIHFLVKSEKSSSLRDLILSVAFLTLSLCTKHIFIIFLFWLYIRTRGRLRFLLSAVPLGLYLLHFLPFVLIGKGRVIWEQVFLYWSANNAPLWRFFVKDQDLVKEIGNHQAWHHGRLWMVLFLGAMIISALQLRKVELSKSLALYTVFLVVFASAITTQFYAIAIFGVFCLFNPVFLYFIFVGAYMTLVGTPGLLKGENPLDFFPISTWDFPPHALILGLIFWWLTSRRSMKKKSL